MKKLRAWNDMSYKERTEIYNVKCSINIESKVEKELLIIQLYNMQIMELSKDILYICTSYLTGEEIVYSVRSWYRFPYKIVCNTAARNGWLDLLVWSRKCYNYKDELTCKYAAKNNHTVILEWLKNNGCGCTGMYHAIK